MCGGPPRFAPRGLDARSIRGAATPGATAGVEHVYCFENRGEEIGVTLHHPHGQI